MDPRTRQRLIDLLRLDRDDLDAVIGEVRNRENPQEVIPTFRQRDDTTRVVGRA